MGEFAAAATSIGFQTHDVWQWVFVAVPLAFALALAPVLYRLGNPSGSGISGLLLRLGSGLERLFHLPAWAAAGFSVGMWSLTVAYVGFVWDVAWHADNGRDQELFTVPHTMILLGLGGIAASAVAMVLFASLTRANVGWRLRRVTVPYSAQPMALLGLGALIGFPLDDLWHATFGIDITMWSPTHLLMIGAASLTPVVLWLVLAEATPTPSEARRLFAHTAGIVLIGLSTFQLEFDLGIPQWQMLYDPILVAAAAGIVLVAARAAGGRGGALVAVLYYLVIRAAVTLLVGPGLGHSLSHFPLYAIEAACVELVFLARRRLAPFPLALAAGGLIGTVGLAAEAFWTQRTFVHPWTGTLLPYAWMFVVVALAASVVGLGVGRRLVRQPTGMPRFAATAALAVIAVAIIVHLPARHLEPADVTLQSQQVGSARPVVDRYGNHTLERQVNVELSVNPDQVVRGADFFEVVSWQGGSPVRHAALLATSPGHYRTIQAVPAGGNWKSLVYLSRGDTLDAVPVAMPADPLYGLPGVDAPANRTAAMLPASSLLMRESHGGANSIAYAIFAAFAILVLSWIASIGYAYRELAGGSVKGQNPPLAQPRFRRALS